jgi:membrane dipeptidase
MPVIIDGHEDLAWNALNFGRDYRRSARETRDQERQLLSGGSPIGETLLGWPEYQAGQVGLVFATIFASHQKYTKDAWDRLTYVDSASAARVYGREFDFYEKLTSESPDQFRLIRRTAELENLLKLWQEQPAHYPETAHPVGLVLLMEGAEGLRDWDQLSEWYERGLRILGPVWAGGRFFGGTREPGPMTAEGRALLEAMQEIGFVLDTSHMSDESALAAMDAYDGTIIAGHANVRSVLGGAGGERHLTQRAISHLVEHDGVVGVIPYNRFLDPNWYPGAARDRVRLEHLVNHVDAVCQIAGDAHHVAIGTDFDGGFGWPAVPLELNTIADLQKLSPVLSERGYTPEDVEAIFGGNWRRILERSLPQ